MGFLGVSAPLVPDLIGDLTVIGRDHREPDLEVLPLCEQTIGATLQIANCQVAAGFIDE
jgi:hypothetical protein